MDEETRSRFKRLLELHLTSPSKERSSADCEECGDVPAATAREHALDNPGHEVTLRSVTTTVYLAPWMCQRCNDWFGPDDEDKPPLCDMCRKAHPSVNDAAVRDLIRHAHESDAENVTVDLAESLADIRRRAGVDEDKPELNTQ